jgi:hypothetical protein
VLVALSPGPVVLRMAHAVLPSGPLDLPVAHVVLAAIPVALSAEPIPLRWVSVPLAATLVDRVMIRLARGTPKGTSSCPSTYNSPPNAK